MGNSPSSNSNSNSNSGERTPDEIVQNILSISRKLWKQYHTDFLDPEFCNKIALVYYNELSDLSIEELNSVNNRINSGNSNKTKKISIVLKKKMQKNSNSSQKYKVEALQKKVFDFFSDRRRVKAIKNILGVDIRLYNNYISRDAKDYLNKVLTAEQKEHHLTHKHGGANLNTNNLLTRLEEMNNHENNKRNNNTKNNRRNNNGKNNNRANNRINNNKTNNRSNNRKNNNKRNNNIANNRANNNITKNIENLSLELEKSSNNNRNNVNVKKLFNTKNNRNKKVNGVSFRKNIIENNNNNNNNNNDINILANLNNREEVKINNVNRANNKVNKVNNVGKVNNTNRANNKVNKVNNVNRINNVNRVNTRRNKSSGLTKDQLCKSIITHYAIRANIIGAIVSALPLKRGGKNVGGLCSKRIASLETGKYCLPPNFDKLINLEPEDRVKALNKYIFQDTKEKCNEKGGIYKELSDTEKQGLVRARSKINKEYLKKLRLLKSYYNNKIKELETIILYLDKPMSVDNEELESISKMTREILDEMYSVCQAEYLLSIMNLMSVDLTYTKEDQPKFVSQFEELKKLSVL